MATATASLKRMYIDGKWCEADNGKTLGVINPATEEVLEEIAYGGRVEVRRALEAAHKAMPGWMKLTSWDRGKILKKTADLMRQRLDSIARTMTMEQGKPLAESKAEVLHSADTFEWFAEEGFQGRLDTISGTEQVISYYQWWEIAKEIGNVDQEDDQYHHDFSRDGPHPRHCLRGAGGS